MQVTRKVLHIGITWERREATTGFQPAKKADGSKRNVILPRVFFQNGEMNRRRIGCIYGIKSMRSFQKETRIVYPSESGKRNGEIGFLFLMGLPFPHTTSYQSMG